MNCVISWSLCVHEKGGIRNQASEVLFCLYPICAVKRCDGREKTNRKIE
jgi:hypothetical protein